MSSQGQKIPTTDAVVAAIVTAAIAAVAMGFGFKIMGKIARDRASQNIRQVTNHGNSPIVLNDLSPQEQDFQAQVARHTLRGLQEHNQSNPGLRQETRNLQNYMHQHGMEEGAVGHHPNVTATHHNNR